MRLLLLRKGHRRLVYAIGYSSECELRAFIRDLLHRHPAKAEKLVAILDRFSNGQELYRNAVKALKGKHAEGIREFRASNVRMLWFEDPEDGKIVICTHAFIKKSQETPRKEIEKAQRLRAKYIDAKQAGHVEYLED